MAGPFAKRYSAKKRAAEASRIIRAHPDKIPVICERSATCRNLPELSRAKYLVPKDLTFGQFYHVVRQRARVAPSVALFFYVGDSAVVPASSRLLCEMYEAYKNEDGFLYITYAGENTFGSAPLLRTAVTETSSFGQA